MAASAAFAAARGDVAASVASEPATSLEAAATAEPRVGLQRWPQLIPLAQLFAVVLGVFAIIWNQQQTTNDLRSELRGDIRHVETTLRGEMEALRVELRGEMEALEIELRGEIDELRAEIDELRDEVVAIGQRLARIEGHLGIDVPDPPPE